MTDGTVEYVVEWLHYLRRRRLGRITGHVSFGFSFAQRDSRDADRAVIAVLKVPITKCPKILNAKWISLGIEELLIWIVQLKRHNQSL